MKIKIDINLPSNEYLPKSINTKPVKTNRAKVTATGQTDKVTYIENYNIDY